jgi:hypothetical protein
MAFLLQSGWQKLVACWHRVAGRVWYRLRCEDKARAHFECVLHRLGDDFVAYVYLGRLAYGAGDYAGCRREFEHARRTAPDRFARMKCPFELFEPRAAGALPEETNARATWRSFRSETVPQLGLWLQPGGGVLPRRRGAGREHGAEECDSGRLRRYGDDFGSEQERARFHGLPSIRSQDFCAADLDALARRLTEDH